MSGKHTLACTQTHGRIQHVSNIVIALISSHDTKHKVYTPVVRAGRRSAVETIGPGSQSVPDAAASPRPMFSVSRPVTLGSAPI